ncbi:CBO0543 family protein [Pseudalkalibacillus hwajinpoensis]|uniref:CBO0543 family protein n=1 Tax=Guptibacillus hwajinpoensis TaxID=208199 RepID=UPI00325A8B50
MNQQEHFVHILSLKKELEKTYIEYWQQFSSFSSWQFWVVLAMLLIPLIVLYFKIDRRKIFLLGFFGYSIHVLAAYTDALGIRKSWWDYPYVALPQLPGSIGIDASLIPVYFILLYQWCLNKDKSIGYMEHFLL